MLRVQDNSNSFFPQSPLYTPGHSFISHPNPITAELPTTDIGPPPQSALCDLIGHTQSFVMESQTSQSKHGVLLKFVLTGLLSGVASPPFVIRMCPPLTTKNWAVYQPLLALGLVFTFHFRLLYRYHFILAIVNQIKK